MPFLIIVVLAFTIVVYVQFSENLRFKNETESAAYIEEKTIDQQVSDLTEIAYSLVPNKE